MGPKAEFSVCLLARIHEQHLPHSSVNFNRHNSECEFVTGFYVRYRELHSHFEMLPTKGDSYLL